MQDVRRDQRLPFPITIREGERAPGPGARDAGGAVVCDTADALAAALAARIEVSDARRGILAGLDPDALVAAVHRVHRCESALRAAVRNEWEAAGRGVKTAGMPDPALLEDAPGWAAILQEVGRLPGEFEALKQLALEACRQHVTLYKNALYDLYRERVPDGGGADETVWSGPASRAATEHHPGVSRAGGHGRVVRLPRGKRVPVRTPPGGEFRMRLASRAFRVRSARVPYLLDEGGERWLLRNGRNLVGRALHNDVVLPPDYGDVSRTHVLVEVEEGRLVALTDRSSQGTWIERGTVAVGPGHS